MPETLPSKVFAVDDDATILGFIQTVMQHHDFPIEVFPTGEEFLSQADLQAIGCVIIDLNLPGMSGAEIQEQLRQSGSVLSVIIASGKADVATAVKIMQKGAVTLLEKPYSSTALVDAVTKGIERSREVFSRKTQSHSVQARLATLSEDEREVLEGLLLGHSNKFLAQKLVLSSRTVERHRSSVLKKMQVASIAELATLISTWSHAENHAGL